MCRRGWMERMRGIKKGGALSAPPRDYPITRFADYPISPVEPELELDRPRRVLPLEAGDLVARERRAADAADRQEVRMVEGVQHFHREFEVRVSHDLRLL